MICFVLGILIYSKSHSTIGSFLPEAIRVCVQSWVRTNSHEVLSSVPVKRVRDLFMTLSINTHRTKGPGLDRAHNYIRFYSRQLLWYTIFVFYRVVVFFNLFHHP